MATKLLIISLIGLLLDLCTGFAPRVLPLQPARQRLAARTRLKLAFESSSKALQPFAHLSHRAILSRQCLHLSGLGALSARRSTEHGRARWSLRFDVPSGALQPFHEPMPVLMRAVLSACAVVSDTGERPRARDRGGGHPTHSDGALWTDGRAGCCRVPRSAGTPCPAPSR